MCAWNSLRHSWKRYKYRQLSFFFFLSLCLALAQSWALHRNGTSVKPSAIRKSSRSRVRDKSSRNKHGRPIFRSLQPTDALTSENHLKGVLLDRLHRRLIDAPEQQSRRIRATPASSFIFFLQPNALATIPPCIKRHWPLPRLRVPTIARPYVPMNLLLIFYSLRNYIVLRSELCWFIHVRYRAMKMDNCKSHWSSNY